MKPRPWFQLHLSTLLVLSFAAGGLIWANLRRVPTQHGAVWIEEGELHPEKTVPSIQPHWRYGFPLTAYTSGYAGVYFPQWHAWHICLNVVVAFTLLVALALPLEWLARKQP